MTTSPPSDPTPPAQAPQPGATVEDLHDTLQRLLEALGHLNAGTTTTTVAHTPAGIIETIRRSELWTWLEHAWSALGLAALAVGASGASPHAGMLTISGAAVTAASALGRGMAQKGNQP